MTFTVIFWLLVTFTLSYSIIHDHDFTSKLRAKVHFQSNVEKLKVDLLDLILNPQFGQFCAFIFPILKHLNFIEFLGFE